MMTAVGLRNRIMLGDSGSHLEARLSRTVFSAGGQLSGVVILRLARRMDIRSLTVTAKGVETASRAAKGGARQPSVSFFQRDVLLSGREQPRFASERISQYWNAFLKRDTGRALTAGEYAYPFSIALPASLPASCNGKYGKIAYYLTVRLNFPLLKSQQMTFEVPVASALRDSDEEGFSLSHSALFGGRHATGADLTVSLPSRGFSLGSTLRGQITITNPREVAMESVSVFLNAGDGSRSAAREYNDVRSVDSCRIQLEDHEASKITADFEVAIPSDAPPSVEGMSMVVRWTLDVVVESCPPLEIQVPILVHTPVT